MKVQIIMMLIIVLFVDMSFADSCEDPYIVRADPTNTFLKGMGLSDDINTFTGDVSLHYTLAGLKGRNGIGFTLKLSYDSDVNEIATGENKNKQASYCGLGWHLNIPCIQGEAAPQDCTYTPQMAYEKLWYVSGNKKNTMEFIDDTSGFKLKDYKYWFIDSTSVGGNAWDVSSWQIIDEAGLKYTFAHKRNRVFRVYDKYYTNCKILYNHPQSQYASFDTLAYQWDLTRIEDPFGNSIDFEYLDTIDTISDSSRGSVDPDSVVAAYDYAEYTKDSVPRRIIDNTAGHCIELGYITRTDTSDGYNGHGDWMDLGINESDSYQEIYCEKKLYLLKVYDRHPDSTGARYYKLLKFGNSYSSFGSDNKLILTSISECNPADSTIKIPSMKFEYCSQTEDNPGAIEKITFPHGGSKKFVYESRTGSGATGYRVDSLVVNDGINGDFISDYTWPAADTSGGVCGHDSVTVDLHGTDYGRIRYFHDTDTQFGVMKKKKMLNESNETMSYTGYQWSFDTIDTTAYYKKLEREYTWTDGKIIKDMYYSEYDSCNGLPTKMRLDYDDITGDRCLVISYAHTSYSDMKEKHMLSQKAQETIHRYNDASSYARFSKVTTWKEWATGKWGPHKTYQWLENDATYGLPTFDFSNWSNTGEPTSEPEWVRMAKIDSVDSYGNVLMAEDADGTESISILGLNSSQVIAAGQNGHLEEFGFSSFENGEGNGWNNETKIIKYDDAHSGSYVARVWTSGGESQYGPTQNFSESDGLKADCGYRASVWVKGPASAYLIMKINNQQELSDTQFSSNSGEWELLTVELSESVVESNMDGDDYIRVFVGNNNTTAAYFDDLHFYPVDGLISASVHDSSNVNIVSLLSGNNIPSYSIYDSFNRQLYAVDSDGRRLSMNSPYYSRDGNGENFSSSDPNFGHQIVYSDQDGFSDFRSDDGWSKTDPSNTTFNYLYAGRITVKMASTSSNCIYKSISEDNISAKVDFYPDATTGGTPKVLKFWDSGNIFCVRYLPSIDRFDIRVRKNIGDITYPDTLSLVANPGSWYTIEIEKTQGGYCRACAYPMDLGRYAGDCYETSGYPSEWGTYVMSYCDDPSFYLANHYVGKTIQTKTFTDGFGRTIQTQAHSIDNDIVTKSTINALGLLSKEGKPQLISNWDHDFIIAVPDTSKQYGYYKDPLGRIKTMYYSNLDSLQYVYGVEIFNGTQFGDRRHYEKIVDEEGIASKQFTDRHGNLIGKILAAGDNDSLKTVFDFDELGNLTETEPPNHWVVPSGTSADDWDTELIYNTFNQLTCKITPDDDTTKFVYDFDGNIRFQQDARQAEDDYFTAYVYDDLDRIISIGEERDQSFNWTTSFPPTDSTSFGSQVDEWRVKNYYDENYVSGTDNFCQGELTKTEINVDSDGTAEHVIKYVYDQFGNLLEKRVTIDEGNAVSEKTIKHVYDHLGREIETCYPSGNTVVLTYDELGRLKNASVVD